MGYWPNPTVEAFRRPLRTAPKVHLECSRRENPNLISHFKAKGYNVYFQDEEEDYFNFNFDLNPFAHKNKYERLTDLTDMNMNMNMDRINDDDDDEYDMNNNCIIDVKNYVDCNNNVNIDKNNMYDEYNGVKVPESTMQKCSICNKNNKNTYLGYMCSIINPQNSVNSANFNPINSNNHKNKYNNSYITNLKKQMYENSR